MSTTQEEFDIATPDGTAHAWGFRPAGTAQLPGIVMFPDAFGPRKSIFEMAARLASGGFYVLAPDVFHRSRPFAPFDVATAFTVPAERERLMKIMHDLSPELAMRDAGAFFDALAKRPNVRPDGFGTTGYCMGGRLSFLAAGHHPGRVRAAMSFHGGRIVTDQPDSPHLQASKIQAALYFGVADNDTSCSADNVATLAKSLADAHLDFTIELYRGKQHGFAVLDHAGPYDPAASARHFARMQTFFTEKLGSAA